MSTPTIRFWFARRDATDDSPAVTFREPALVLSGQIVTPQRKSVFTMDAAAARQLYQMWERAPRAPEDSMFVDVRFDVVFVRGRFHISTAPGSSFPHVSMFVGPRLPGKTAFDSVHDIVTPETRSVYLSSRHRRSVLTCFVERGKPVRVAPGPRSKPKPRPPPVAAQRDPRQPRVVSRRPRVHLSWYQ